MSNDERRARQMIEDQLRVISSVCKKLNQDIEVNTIFFQHFAKIKKKNVRIFKYIKVP